MTVVPTGWQLASLEDLLSEPLMNGRSVPDAVTGAPVLRLTSVRNALVDLSQWKTGDWTELDAQPYLVTPGDLLVVRGNGSLDLVGRAGLVGEVETPVAYPDTLIRVRVLTNTLNARFLALLWNSPVVRRQIESRAQTTAGIYKVNQKHVRAVQLPVPPLSEQQSIVDILGDHLSRLDSATAAIISAALRAVGFESRGMLRELLPGVSGVDLEHLIMGQAPTLPNGWRWAQLADVAAVSGGITKDTKRQGDPSLPAVPYLRVANVQRGRLDLSDVATIRTTPAKAASLRLLPGDVLLNEGGDRDKLARGWVWNDEIAGCIHQNHVFRARPHQNQVRPEWLAWCANTYGARWAQRHGRQSVNLASISLSTIRRMPIPVPPLAVQDRSLSTIHAIREAGTALGTAVTIASRRTEVLRRALFAAAFSGRLTSHSSDLDLAEELASA